MFVAAGSLIFDLLLTGSFGWEGSRGVISALQTGSIDGHVWTRDPEAASPGAERPSFLPSFLPSFRIMISGRGDLGHG